MKRLVTGFLLLVFCIACVVSFDQGNEFEEQVATRAAVAFTATSLANLTQTETIAPFTDSTLPTVTVSVVTPSPTISLDDPKLNLGQPSYKDDLSVAANWFSSGTEWISDGTTFYADNGYLSAKSDAINQGFRWYLNYRKPKDAYLEAKFKVESCSGDDQYGLVFRAPSFDQGLAYYYIVTCDGRYDIRRWDQGGSKNLLNFPSSGHINQGSNRENTLGVWFKSDSIRLYMNGSFLQEIQDNSLINDGYFGLFINARQTPGLTVKMDEIAYWLLN